MPNLVLNGVQYSYRDLLMIITENERLRQERDYYLRDNEKLNNALAWEHNESENAKDAARYQWLQADIMRGIAVMRETLRTRDLNAAIDAAREGK